MKNIIYIVYFHHKSIGFNLNLSSNSFGTESLSLGVDVVFLVARNYTENQFFATENQFFTPDRRGFFFVKKICFFRKQWFELMSCVKKQTKPVFFPGFL